MNRSELEALYVPLRQVTHLPPLLTESRPRQTAPLSRIPFFFLGILGALIFLLHAAFYDWLTVDPAYISIRCAENLARRGTLQFNPGDRMEVFANLLWTLQLAVAARLGLPLVAFGKLLGIASAIGLLWWSLALTRWFTRRLRTGAFPELIAGVVVTAILVTSPVLAANSQMGLETTQHALFLSLAFGGAVLAGQTGRLRWSALASAAMTCVIFSRPEGFCYYPFWVAAWLLQNPLNSVAELDRAWRRKFLFFPLAMLGILILWRIWIFGFPWPHNLWTRWLTHFSFSSLEHGFQYWLLSQTFHSPGWIYLFVIPGLVMLFVQPLGLRRKLMRAVLGLTLSWIATSAFAVLAGGDYLGYSRFMVPSLFFLACTLGWVAAFYTHQSRSGAPHFRWAARAQFIVTVLVGLIISQRQITNQYHTVDSETGKLVIVSKPPWLKNAWENLITGKVILFSPFYNLYTSGLVSLAMEQFGPGATVLAPDVGLVGAALLDVPFIDNEGLVSSDFTRYLSRRKSRHSAMHARAELLTWLNQHPPAWLLLYGSKRNPLLAEGFAANDWPLFLNEYEFVTQLDDYGGPLNLDLMRRILVYRRRKEFPPQAAIVTKHYAQLATLFPNSDQVQAIWSDWRNRAGSYEPFIAESVDSQNAAGNRVRTIHGKFLGSQFLGRFDSINSTEGWHTYGQAFEHQPRLDPVFGQQPPSDYVGRGYLNSFHSAERELSKGWAESPPFTPSPRDELLFWIAGGSGPDVGVELCVDQKLVKHWSGFGHNRLSPILINLTPWAGHALTLRVIDRSSMPDGWVLADQFLLLRPTP